MKRVIRAAIKRFIFEMIDKLRIKGRRKSEIIKFKDPRRRAIYETVALTEEQQQSIDGLYGLHYGEKIPYTWHRHFTAFTGRFDERYFPELLYIPEFEHFENPFKEYTRVFEDKNIISLLAKGIGVRTPEVLCSRQAGMYRDAHYNPINLKEMVEIIRQNQEVFIKPSVNSNSGNGCTLLKFGGGYEADEAMILGVLETLGDDFVVQKRIKCHESLSRIYADSVNTFRVITYRWYEGGQYVVRHMPVILRIGQGGSYLDNAHAGGMFIAVNDDGTLHDKAFTEFKDVFYEHPDTGLVFDGYRIDLMPEVIKCAHRCASALAAVGSFNWDFTLDEDGEPMLIEANCAGGGIWVVEMAHGKGCFGDDTEAVLDWMGKVKNMTLEERKNYYFGKMS